MAKLKSTDLNGNLFVSGQLKLVNPFLISTDSLITNLNADLLDGYHANDLIVQSSKCYDTSTSDTKDGTWTVSIPGITELTEGLTIKIRLKRAGASTCTLNLNDLGAKTVYFRYGAKLTTHYSKESVIALTYTTNATSSGTDRTGWIVENIYDSTNTQQLRKYYSRYTTKTVLYRYMFCFVNKDNLLIPANNVNNSIATNKTLTTDSFDLSKGIYYYGSTRTVAAGGIIDNGVLYQQSAVLDLRYSFNTGTTLTPHKPVYVIVTPTGSSGEVVLASNPIAQTLPTADDGNRYVFLGYSTDNYRIELTIDHPVYVYNSIAKAYVAENYSQEADIKNLKDNFVINSQAKGGFVSAGGTNYNKVWKTDWSGNPAWRDVITYRDLGVDTKFQNLDLATERDVIYYTTASAVVAKLSPLPTGVSTYGEAFVQTVWCGSVKYLVQDFTWRSGTNFRRFSRTCNNGTFGPWYEYAYKNHLDSYQPKDGDLTAIAGLSGTGFLKRTGDNAWSLDTIDPTQYYWANVKISKTSSNTTFPRFKSLRAGNTVYNIATLKTTTTPVETVLHTGIKWTSSSYMPIIHLTGYAYGLTSPVEFKIGFYIYNNQIGWCGVTNMGAWKPDVLLFKETRNGVDYVAVGLKGACYFLMLEANLQENMNDIPSSIDLNPSLWYFRTQTADQVKANGSTIPEGGNAPQSICVKVPYRTIRTNVDSADNAATSNKLVSLNTRPASANFAHEYVNNLVSQKIDVSSSLMTTGKPDEDGFITTYFWDKDGSYDAQLFIPNRDYNDGRLQVRYRIDKDNADTHWGSTWKSIPYTSDLDNYTKKAIGLSDNISLDTVTESGFYRLNMNPNFPHAQMIVCRGADTIAQMVFPYDTTRMYVRTGNPFNTSGGLWHDWKQVAFTDNINNGTLTLGTNGTGISGSATFSANQSGNSTFTVTLDSSAAGNRAANKVVLAKAAGQIDSDKFAVTSAGTKKSTIQYNTTEGCLEFVFE